MRSRDFNGTAYDDVFILQWDEPTQTATVRRRGEFETPTAFSIVLLSGAGT